MFRFALDFRPARPVVWGREKNPFRYSPDKITPCQSMSTGEEYRGAVADETKVKN
jgi:hypothetical protein